MRAVERAELKRPKEEKEKEEQGRTCEKGVEESRKISFVIRESRSESPNRGQGEKTMVRSVQ
jgi:hypothetical protein